MTPVLEARGIVKQFPGVLANDQVNFTLERGEIHALLGENGAGKTTLMNILYGLYQPDAGEILVKGESVAFAGPNDAIRRGIGMVHQHFMLVPVFTVAENIVLGEEIVRAGGWWLDRQAAVQRVTQISKEHWLEVDPRALVKDLPVGLQQRVEIIKLLFRNAEVLILDEPTSVLTPQETQELFKIMLSLTTEGKSIIFITHKLKEVMAAADRISVMHAGRMVGTVKPGETDEQQLAEMMVGRKIILQVDKGAAHPQEPVLEVAGLTVLDDQHHPRVDGLNLTVRAGEILGIAGVQGNGQTEMVEALTGLRRSTVGTVTILGKDMTHATPRHVIEAGVGHIPEDREKHGLVKSYSVVDNLVLCTYYRPPFANGVVLQEAAMLANAEKLIAEFDIRPTDPKNQVGALSGGNKQKVIVARELSRGTKLLIASQPTRGLDVGSIEFIHQRIVQARDAGLAVLLVSSELDEILALADRVAVMFKGQIIDTLPIAQATREKIGLLMAGIREKK
jgi:simple sugar transport system ATP-binding protein